MEQRAEHAPREVAPGLWVMPLRTPTLPPATHTNAVLVGSGDALLVEPASPFPDEIERTLRWVEQARVQRGLRLRAILLTHHHPDHAGGAAALSQRLGLPLWAHAQTAARLEGEVAFDRLLQDGERVPLDGSVPTAVDVMYTPGHAPGHLCFTEARSGAMIAGDMVASVGTILVEPRDGDMQLYLRSLERMAACRPSFLIPAHGGVIDDPQERIRFYIRHRGMREHKVLGALRSFGGPATPTELVPTAYDDAPRQAWRLAAGAVHAHLIKLAREGRVEQRGERFVASPT